ncbi:anthranilate phosphoribosyltransferase [Actinobacillus pleuropneumoniae]|uniref:Anthranilate phosphoribosyltransferase n=1 Tax=Actinobacillus pleuropneumoniae TaxID=715 RepID=A0ABN5MJ66_ACTPL|nr:anthranilate phosphoribosyltransferase [Actinobacillus pleuropneumoniae]ASU14994.1 Bifunctional protein TrpGD [Actinobacillus pleuropneumoniae]AWG95599.1 anthranilate phosphoribosyltransferase [Actinobacillus pleuropneumoniae serovar 1 str. 4074]AXA21669.1 anthranilate phosphoribosyltransferase [Actinobacillus pleuropneumoniae]EFM93911.1 Anthranilate phosphoribosyltransferase [Actinobacillus pleuropneumoniae serovar 9 str. CVJ13261]EFM98297.1 Anthranilate phosphoribosyltransferase [Actinoba
MQLDNILSQLFENQALTKAESQYFFEQVIQGNVSNEQLAGALIALKVRGETIEEIAGAVEAAFANATAFPAPDYAFADIVGTGGDGQNTINISTASAIVAATLGYKVAKHGSRSVSSKTGASDVLSALGINVTISPQTARQALDENNLCFLFAPLYHAGFKHAVPVRQTLKTRTLFNILGPLVNPAHAKRQLLGVYSPEVLKIYAETVRTLNYQHSIVVYGSGLDEVAVHGETLVAEIEDDKIHYFSLIPEDFGVQRHSIEALRGGEPTENAEKITALLQGKGEAAHIDAVAVNTAMLMRTFGERDLKANVQRVKDLLRTDKAYQTLQNLAQYQ